MAHENLDNYTDIRLDHVTAIRTRLKKKERRILSKYK